MTPYARSTPSANAAHSVIAFGKEHVPAAAKLLADAFEVDPAYRYLFPDRETRRASLSDYFARTLQLHVAFRCCYALLDEHGALCATVTIRPPTGLRIRTLTMLRRGLLPFALAHGTRTVERLFWLKRTYEQLEVEACHSAPHRLVHMMASAPAHQGRGLGSQLLAHALSATQPESVPLTVLTTHLEPNLVFYQRAGFEVCDRRLLHPPASAPYAVWSMRRVESNG
jgi:GNAT superfamily N-acetyltransferase